MDTKLIIKAAAFVFTLLFSFCSPTLALKTNENSSLPSAGQTQNSNVNSEGQSSQRNSEKLQAAIPSNSTDDTNEAAAVAAAAAAAGDAAENDAVDADDQNLSTIPVFAAIEDQQTILECPIRYGK